MRRKTLSSTNPYLKAISARQRIVSHVTSSTAIETGKPSGIYINRYHLTGSFAAGNKSTHRKK